MRCLPLLFLFGSVTLMRSADLQLAGRTPVLLELFTSEGCSSCPPADKLLQRLDHDQPISNAALIVFSEHVDYWNHDGWADPYSSPEFSRRQERYASLLNSDVYTPQLVIDGRRQVVGGDLQAVENAIRDAVRLPKASVQLTAKKEAEAVRVQVEISALPGGGRAAVYLAFAADRVRSHVMRGENAGRELEHVAVVQSLVKIGDVAAGSTFRKDARSTLPANQHGPNMRVVVVVQDTASGRILGVAQDRL